MSWTRAQAKDGRNVMQVHKSGGHITAVPMGPGADGRQTYMFDAWMPGMGGFWRNLGSYRSADNARLAVLMVPMLEVESYDGKRGVVWLVRIEDAAMYAAYLEPAAL